MHRKLPNVVAASFLSGVMAVSSVGPMAAQNKPAETGTASMPKVGEMAPDFKLQYIDGKQEKEVSLADYRGKKNVVVAFFIFAFTGG